ncbi:CTL-like protein 1 [Blattella germanica]|nr:CTL-like protein 1 [Blattella germanica]
MSCCCDDDSAGSEDNHNWTRGCTDVLWLCLFVLFWFVMIFIAAFAYVYGNPLRLINGYDSFGNTCGYPYNEKMGNLELSGLNTSDKPYNFDLKSKDWQDKNKTAVLQSTMGPCPPLPIYDSVPVLNRCVPRPVKESIEQVYNLYSVLNSWDTVEQVLADFFIIDNDFRPLPLGFSGSLDHFGHSLHSITGTGVLWWTYAELKHQLDNTPDSQLLEESVNNESAFLIYSITATIITVIILLLVIAVCKSINNMAQLFEDSAECLADLPCIFMLPFITFTALVIFFAFWVSVIVCLATSSYPGAESVLPFTNAMLTPETAPVQSFSSLNIVPLKNISLIGMKRFTFLEFVEPTWVRYMWWLYLIGLIWVSEFILSCQQMVIANAVSQWVFANQRRKNASVLSSMGKLICYHLGSVAKGSMLITIFKLPRLILTYMDRKLRKMKDAGSECASCGLKCCICCLYCLENFIKFMNHNAYTVIAMEGYNFCTAAKIAFSTLVNNALDLITLNSVGDFVLFLGKCFVTAITGSIGLIIMKQNSHLHFYAIPTLVVCIFSYFIAHCVLSLYEIVIDTMFLCVCEGKRLYGNDWGKLPGRKRETNGNPSMELEPMNN